MTLVFPPKAYAESRKFGFDLAAELAEGETVSEITPPVFTVTALVADLDDPAGTTLTASGAAEIDGTVVRRRYTKGTVGQTYAITAVVTTSASNVLQFDGLLTIVPMTP